MKNLKKALSVVLASAMLFGMMVVGTGAAHADVKAEHNVEAIAVVSAAGIMGANEEFNPDANITRNEMAVVMVNMLDLDVADYKGASNFTDVPAWAADYVDACYANGIVSGVSATEYNGGANVTTAEAALMMLKALGYFDQAKLNDWLLDTIKMASKIDLLDGIDAKATAKLTRNDVAQLALNALEATCVEEIAMGSNTSIKGEDIEITIDSNVVRNDLTTSRYDYNASEENTLQLIEKLYGADFSKGDTTDKFGRPGFAWVDEEEDEEIVFIADKALAVYAAGEMDADTLTDDFDEDDWNSENTFSVIYNGSTHAQNLAWFYGANGVTIEVYGDKDDKVIETVVAIEAYIAEVTEVVTDEDDKVEAMELTVYLPGFSAEIDIDVEDDEDAYELVKGYEEDDFLMVTVAQDWETEGADALMAVADVKAIEGEITAKSLDAGLNGWVKIDGVKYETAWVYAGAAADLNKESEGTFYLVDNFVVYADTTEAETDDVYAVVLQAGQESTWNSVTYKAEVLYMDGTTEVIETVEAARAGTAVTVEYDEDEEAYALEIVDVTDLEDATIEKGKTAIVDDEANVVAKANGKTVYLIIKLDDGEFDSAKSYTGYKSVASTDVTALVVIGEGTAEYVIAVYGSAVDAESDDMIYVVGASRSDNLIEDEIGNYYTYTALVAGEIVEIMATDSDLDGLYSDATIDEDDIYTALTPAADVTTTAAGVKFEKAADDVITIAGDEFAYADDCALYVVDEDSIVKGSISKNYFDVTVSYTTNDDGEIDLIFVIK